MLVVCKIRPVMPGGEYGVQSVERDGEHSMPLSADAAPVPIVVRCSENTRVLKKGI